MPTPIPSPSPAPPANEPGAALQQVRADFLRWQACAAQAGQTLRAPPPEPDTCCGRGCHGCVWEGFYAAAQYWCEEAQLQLDD